MKLRTHPSKHHAHPACVCFNMFNVSSTVPQDNNFHHMSPSKREWGEEERFFISIVSSIIPPMQYWVHRPPRGHERWWPGRHQYDSSLASVGSKKLQRRRRGSRGPRFCAQPSCRQVRNQILTRIGWRRPAYINISTLTPCIFVWITIHAPNYVLAANLFEVF